MSAEIGPRTALVVGGGWSGIAAAWYLHRSGAAVTLLDEQPTLGGRSSTVHLGDRRITLGGKNIGSKYEEFRTFVAEMKGGEFEHFGINSSRVVNGRVVTLDGKSPVAGMLEVARRAGPFDIYRFLRLVGYVRGDDANRFVRGPQFVQLSKRRGDPALDGYFGRNLLDALIRPMTVRMNGAEPDEIQLADFGANLGMLLDRFDQLTDGMEPTYRRFSSTVTVENGTRAIGLLTEDGRVTGVDAIDAAGQPQSYEADLVVIAIPAPAAAELLRTELPVVADELACVRYNPATVVVTAYDRPVFGPVARSLVFEPDSAVSNAGAYGVDDRHIVRYTFSGRAARPYLTEDFDKLRMRAEAQLSPHFPAFDESKAVAQVGRHWEHAFCAYSHRHADRVARIDAAAGEAGLVLVGDYRRGTSIEACFRGAKEQVEAVTRAR